MISRRTFLLGGAVLGTAGTVSLLSPVAKLFNILLSINPIFIENLTERKLIQRIKAGDIKAYQHFYERHFTSVFDYIHNRVSKIEDLEDTKIEDVEDITADVFFRAFQILSTQQQTSTPIQAWLLHLANEQIIMRPGSSSSLYEMLNPSGEEAQQLTKALATLSPLQQRIIYWAFYKNYSNLEISRLIDRPANSVGVMKLRTLKQLGRAIASD
jgi:DNA-directed RNA polymerase specialized sigma24 family protein